MRIIYFLQATLCGMICVTAISCVLAEDKIDYQKLADGARWSWNPQMTNPLGCITQCGDKYDVNLLSKKNDRSTYTITILLGDRKIYTWKGHGHSVFRILGDRLYWAKFYPSGSGGDIVAVDLKTAKVLWTSPLKAIGPVQHSGYTNLMTLDTNYDVVSIYGNEVMGKYFELKSTTTGKTVGHKLFPMKKKGAKSPGNTLR